MDPIGKRPLLPGTLKNLYYPPDKGEYKYFEAAAAFHFDGENTLVRAAWAADAAMLAYARYGLTPMTRDDVAECLSNGGLKLNALLGNWDGHGTQGFFASNERFAFLSFRGTEKGDPIDQLDDADLVLVSEGPCLVHQGFKRALDRVWNDVQSCIATYRASYPNAEICLTGHSLGAALATLAFSRLTDPNLSLITVGCPRVGNDAFRDRVLANANAARIQRIVNLNDPVAHIPLESKLYRHAPDQCLRFDGDGVLSECRSGYLGDFRALGTTIWGLPEVFSGNAPDGLVDHSPARYCIRLWNLFRE